MSQLTTSKQALVAGVLSLGCVVGASAQSAGSSTGGGAMPNNSRPAAAKNGTSNAVASADRAFAQKAAIGGMVEVELGKLAQQKAASDEVKQFGARMVQDHSKANDELKQIASTKGLQLPQSLDAKHQKDVDRLQKMSGASFDRAYMSDMLDDHKQDIAEFKKEASSGRDNDIKGFASKTLPTLQEHLQMAQATNGAVKKGAK